MAATAQAPPLPAAHIPSLNGLRAISILLVLLGHLEGTRHFPADGLRAWMGEYANLGVRVFFIISGFLITRLLLDEFLTQGRVSLKLFYLRRALRIFPAFFAFIGVIGIFAALGLIVVPLADFIYASAYIINYKPDRSWYLGHLWSLSIEEQFYLLWPWTFAALGVGRAWKVAVAVILFGPVARALVRLFLWDHPMGHTPLFPIVADSLAAGCLLACVRERLWQWPLYSRVLASKSFLFLAPILVLAINRLREYTIVWVFGETILNLTIVLLIDRFVSWPKGGFASFLNTRPLEWIGLLSYSLYLWQQPFLNRNSTQWFASFPFNITLAVVCACLSYYLLEKPLMRLRKRLRPQHEPVAAGVGRA